MDQPFGFAPGGDGKPFDMNALGAMLQQLGAMMQRAEGEAGAVSWQTIRETAEQQITASGDQDLTQGQLEAVADAVRLAQTWLDENTDFPASAAGALAWNRRQWLAGTLEGWRPLVNPVAEGLSEAVAGMSTQMQLPEEVTPEMQAAIAPLMAMARKMSAVSTGMQLGSGFAALSSEVLTSADISAPLTADQVPALLPNTITKFAADYSLPVAEVMLYLATREAASQRLFAAHPWLRRELADSIARYAHGIKLDDSRIREAMAEMDPSDPASMQQLVAGGAFQPPTTDAQKRALAQMELNLALVEGWVAAVAQKTLVGRLATAGQIEEVLHRRSAAGGPTGRTFANLVGLDLQPKLVRTAIDFWLSVTDSLGPAGRDHLWSHPDLLPGTEDLADPAAFISRGEDSASL